MNSKRIYELSDKELRALLLTCDGQGKSVKEEALDELINRSFISGQDSMDGYL
jgi:hypothetical protein